MDSSLEEMQEMEEEGLILSPTLPSQAKSPSQTSQSPHPPHPPNPPSLEPGPTRFSRRLSFVRVPAPRRQPRPLQSQEGERERSRSPTPTGARRLPHVIHAALVRKTHKTPLFLLTKHNV